MYKKINIDKSEYGGGVYGVAFSGGRDSAALLHAMKEAGFSVFAINVEHGIRGERSVSDSEFAKGFCDKYGIDFKGFSVDAPAYSKERGLTIEQGARELRYGIFNKILAEGACDYIALAHHACDQSETILMRILRGTGVRGLVGMKKINGKFVRPLLDYTRSDIDNYIHQNGIPYVDDETNTDTTYTRNFLRAELDDLRRRFPALDESFARLSRNASETDCFLNALAGRPEINDGEAYMDISALSERVTAKRVIIGCCAALGVTQDIEERHLESVLSLAGAENGKRILLPHNITVHKDGEKIAFSKGKDESGQTEIKYVKGGFSGGGIVTERVSELRKRTGGELYLDEGKLPEGTVVRRRYGGDRFRKFGGGEKSLGDYMTDMKIPLRKRDAVPVIACGSEIYAVAGYEISSLAAVDGESEEIVKLTLQENF